MNSKLLAIFGAKACGGCFMRQHAVIRDQLLFSIINTLWQGLWKGLGLFKGYGRKEYATSMGASLLGMALRRAGGFCRHAWHASLEVVQSCLANTGPVIQLQQPAPSFQALR